MGNKNVKWKNKIKKGGMMYITEKLEFVAMGLTVEIVLIALVVL